ncbi:MAG: class II D-tagatose-bisphosphate aldolase, non-catalytic subunit [Sphingobacteriia bacterium]|nr:class II D-tagatose-bisphosphate aldolase, non-catalytic subunit [Sphingobacteriia bacterium]
MPVQYNKIRNGELKNDPECLLRDRVIHCIDEYLFATRAEQ